MGKNNGIPKEEEFLFEHTPEYKRVMKNLEKMRNLF